MELKLKKEPKEIIKFFSEIKTRSDLCAFLEIDEKTLIYLTRRNTSNNYKEFEIPKKSGGIRKIKAPISTIKIIQRKLSDTLYLYINEKTHKAAHGFVYNRSIKTNADIHNRKRYVLNIDLENFFDSINFGRVRGLFISKLFNFNENIATILAQICCDGSLPQGAPTSPIISNLICYKLDKDLLSLARSVYANYTRYADDITFSFDSTSTHKKLITTRLGDIDLNDISKIIENNGFKINKNKVRINNSNFERKKVTGLVVNDKTNLERRYIKKIRAIINCWEETSLENAALIFFQKNTNKNPTDDPQKMFIKIIKGRINFIKQIKGDCYTWRKLENNYNKLLNNKKPILPTSPKDEIIAASWVIECLGKDENDKDAPFQGTGFCSIDEKGDKFFLTCAHVLENVKITDFYRPLDGIRAKLDIKQIDFHRDVAICKISDIDDGKLWFLKMNKLHSLKEGDFATITGYPNHSLGQKIRLEKSQITGFGVKSAVNFIRTNGKIIEGNSGGAVINENNEVVGIATLGDKSPLGESAFLPIKIIDEL